MTPDMIAAATAKQTKKRKEEKSSTKEADSSAVSSVPTVVSNTLVDSASKKDEVLTAIEIDKRLKALRKKLRLIEDLKEKQVRMTVTHATVCMYVWDDMSIYCM
jgi:hypothetical protein